MGRGSVPLFPHPVAGSPRCGRPGPGSIPAAARPGRWYPAGWWHPPLGDVKGRWPAPQPPPRSSWGREGSERGDWGELGRGVGKRKGFLRLRGKRGWEKMEGMELAERLLTGDGAYEEKPQVGLLRVTEHG